MLVIICNKYGKNPSRTVDATERTRSNDITRDTPSDANDDLYCVKYGKNSSRIVDIFFKVKAEKLKF